MNPDPPLERRLRTLRAAFSADRYRILALDVDGTLLDSVGTLRPSTAEAVKRAARAGLRPVLCTGRRYRRARPVAEQLGLDAPLVCNSGAIVKEPSDHRTLWRADLDEPLLSQVLELFRAHDHPVVSFSDRTPDEADFVVPGHPIGREHFDQFVSLNRIHAEIDPRWPSIRPLGTPHFHLCAVGDRPAMLAFESALHDALPDRLRTFVQKSRRYSGTMCEVLDPSASKWSAILHLAEMWGVAPSEIIAVGDDMNDLPMISSAGLGVAMGHSPPAVLAAASLVVPDHENDGVGHLIGEILGM